MNRSPELSSHFQKRRSSAVRAAQIEFLKRKDAVEAINLAIGNVSLPMHPAMIERLSELRAQGSPFENGAVRYTQTDGMEETRNAFRHIIASSGFDVQGLHLQITDGSSQAIELAILGVCGEAGTSDRPLMIIDPTYTNFTAMTSRVGRSTVAITRTLQDSGRFTLPDFSLVEKTIRERKPGALLVIPYDNPTGQLYTRAQMLKLAELCVRYNLWMISDEAYRELHYGGGEVTSIWGITDLDVPGIEGRRISIETSSKVWNACGLRVGALVSDSEEFHNGAVAEYTASLCPNAIGQYIFAALASVPFDELHSWYERQREYYRVLLEEMNNLMREALPGIIVSSPDAAIYSVVDVRRIVPASFDDREFVLHCAREGAVEMEGKQYTLLVAPMSGFYDLSHSENPGRTQMRIAYVEPMERMKLAPPLFKELLRGYLESLAQPRAVAAARR